MKLEQKVKKLSAIERKIELLQKERQIVKAEIELERLKNPPRIDPTYTSGALLQT